jgi:gluconolactonase
MVTRVTEHIAAPNGIALSPDGKKLYVAPSHQSEMLVYDVVSPGKLENGRTFCTLTQPEGKAGTGGDGMVVDVEGNLYFTTHLGVEIFSIALLGGRLVLTSWCIPQSRLEQSCYVPIGEKATHKQLVANDT